MQQKKLLLLHGWDWKKYPVFAPKHQWENRQEFVDQLREHYDLDLPSLPGFGFGEERRQGSWTLDDYAEWLQRQVVSNEYTAIVGYSFGCAVATHWQYKFRNRQILLLLVSPAIARNYLKRPPRALRTLSIALKRIVGVNLVSWLRTKYLMYWIKNPFVIHGTPFLQLTYSNIVGVTLLDEIRALLEDSFPIKLIFGSQDTATPAAAFLSAVPEARAATSVIPGGSHDIGTSHGPELAAQVVSVLSSVRGQG